MPIFSEPLLFFCLSHSFFFQTDFLFEATFEGKSQNLIFIILATNYLLLNKTENFSVYNRSLKTLDPLLTESLAMKLSNAP